MTARLLLIFLVLSLSATAQVTYHPYPQQYATWLFKHEGMGQVLGYYRVIWSGDTTVNSQTYTRAYAGYGQSATMDPPAQMGYVGAFRQDIPAQKLFFLDLNNVEYDVSIDQFVEEGDTIPATPFLLMAFNFMPDYQPDYVDHLVVETVYLTPEGSTYRSSFYAELFDSTGQQVGMVNYISGVGGSVGYFENGMSLECHSIGSALEWGAPENPASVSCTLDTEELMASSAFRLVPNPAEGMVQLFSKTGMAIQELHILDPSGRMILQQSLSPGMSFSVGMLEAGTYFVCFSVNGKNVSLPLQILR